MTLISSLLLSLLPSAVLGQTRSDRFPTVEERVKLYASNWYEPPCNADQQYRWSQKGESLTVSNLTFGIDIVPDQAFYLTNDILLDCARDEEDNATLPTSSRIQFRHNMRMYCVDCVGMMELMDHHVRRRNADVPLLVQFGDLKTSHLYGLVTLPHFKKFRSAAVSPAALATTTETCQYKPLETVHTSLIMQPIVWKLATSRHYRQLYEVFRHDTPWEAKENKAVFRGQLTGALDGYDKKLDDMTNCQTMRRCRLIVEMHGSPYVDARLTSTRERLPEVLNGIPLTGETFTIREMMKFKGIIMLEGNDVASGLKWTLLSQSIVLMPPPKHTSWAMEELLKPWVHYVPLNEDATDAAEKMKWVVEHDDEARAIAQRGTLWMEDLIFHPDAAREERLIMEELLRRYLAHFTPRTPTKRKK
jgi:hypothetical protein